MRRRFPLFSGLTVVAAALVFAVMAAACGSDTAAPAATSSPGTTAPADTRAAAVDTTTTVGVTMPLIGDPFELVEVAGPIAQQASEDLTVALARLDTSCADGTVTAAELEAVIDPLDRFGAAIEPVLPRISPGLGEALYAEFETQLLLRDCVASAAPDDPSELLVATGRVTAALDRYYGRVLATRDSTASSIWGSRDRLAGALWMRELMESGTELDALIVGSSVAKRAYDPDRLSAELDMVVGNAGAAGASPELMTRWLDEIRASVQPDTIIWGISSTDLYTWCFVEQRIENYEKSAVLRREGFSTATGGARLGWEHLLGPVGRDVYADTLLLDAVAEEYEPGTRGRSINGPQPNESVRERLMGDNADEFAAGEVCAARLPVFNEALNGLLDDGLEVIVVALPMLDELAELHPDGVRGPQDALAEVGRGLPPGVRFIDHSASLDSGLFTDTFHVTEEGRDLLTDRLLAELAAG